MGSTNNAASQNAAANQQVQHNTQQALANLAQFNSANPSPTASFATPAAAPQAGGVQGGGSFGGPAGGAVSPQLAQAMQMRNGAPQRPMPPPGSPTPAAPPGGAAGRPQAPPPSPQQLVGLLSLLAGQQKPPGT